MGLFTSKKTELPAPQLLDTEDQKKARAYMQSYLQSAKTPTAPEAYSGQLSASPQAYESYISPLMESYANRQSSPLYKAAQQNLQQTLQGGFDPTTSDYYKAMKAETMENLANAQTQARQAANIGGMLRSSGRLGQEGKLIRGATQDLNTIMAELAMQERQNQLAAAQQALGYEQLNEQTPLNTLQALITGGSYQTGQQQAALDREYQEYQRQLSEEKYPLTVASQLASPSLYNYYQPTYTSEPSMFEQIMQYGAIPYLLGSTLNKTQKKTTTQTS